MTGHLPPPDAAASTPSAPPAAPPAEREWQLYEAAREAVSEQIARQWSHVQFFVLLNASVVGGGIALLQLLTSQTVASLVILVFAGGFGLSLAAMRVMRENKRYYRILVAKKTLIEHRLGLTEPFPGYERFQVASRAWGALATQDKVRDILADPDGYSEPRLRRGSVSGWIGWTLLGFALFDILVAMAIANAMSGCAAPFVPCTPIP